MNVLAISGSLRNDSYNRKVLAYAKNVCSQLGASVNDIDLKALQLPVYDKDIETAGIPDSVVQLKQAIENADILVISTPEYNHSIPGGLKNAIDWASRGGNSFKNKVAALMGATDGMGGTIRSQEHLRVVLAALNVFVIPYPEVLLRRIQDHLDEQGNITDEKAKSQIEKLLKKAVTMTEKLNA